jgi:hypothetical protein
VDSKAELTATTTTGLIVITAMFAVILSYRMPIEILVFIYLLLSVGRRPDEG